LFSHILSPFHIDYISNFCTSASGSNVSKSDQRYKYIFADLKSVGKSIGGSFGKKIGGNVGASLIRGIFSNLIK